jgi:hypothetical protein
MKKKIFMLLLLPLALAGCSTITNLTPSQLQRTDSGFYRVEAAWQTREQTIRPESIKPLVMVGMDTYPMQPESVVKDRWETFIPVKSDQNLLHYRFKFDFVRNHISAPQEDSKLSPEYTLRVTDKGK